MGNRIKHEDLILQFRAIHGDKYDYSKVKHINTNKEFQPFMDTSHLQAHTSCSEYYGLYLEEELVSATGFSKSTQGKDAEWELKRFSNKLDTVVFGGSSKLFKHFLKLHGNPSVKSFSMDRIFPGTVYEKLGFKHVKTLPPTYFYHKGNEIISRRQAQKKNIHTFIPGYIYDPDKTEVETMNENGYFQVFDTGMSYWLWSHGQCLSKNTEVL